MSTAHADLGHLREIALTLVDCEEALGQWRVVIGDGQACWMNRRYRFVVVLIILIPIVQMVTAVIIASAIVVI